MKLLDFSFHGFVIVSSFIWYIISCQVICCFTEAIDVYSVNADNNEGNINTAMVSDEEFYDSHFFEQKRVALMNQRSR